MSRLGIEIIAVIALLGGFAIWWDHHDKVQQEIGRQQVIEADKAGVERQKLIDDKKLAKAQEGYDAELERIRKAYADNAAKPHAHVVCRSTVPPSGSGETEVHSSENGPPAHGEDSDGVHPDISPALEVFAHRLDQLNAQCRQLNTETH